MRILIVEDEAAIADTDLAELVELLAFLTVYADHIPAHRRRQAVLTLGRVERLIPLADPEAEELEVPQ